MAKIARDARDIAPPVWDLSQERLLIITLVNQRIQFFLVFFSLVVAGALNSRLQNHMSIILFVGALLSWILAIVIFRTQRRMTTVLDILVEDESHPYALVTKAANQRYRIQPMLSYVVPTLCSALLTIGAVLSVLGMLVVAPQGK